MSSGDRRDMQSCNLNSDGTLKLRSRAIDIPQELFEHIIWYVPWLAETLSYTPSPGEWQQNLCALSMVSRYFATLCRPYTFSHLRFRNAKHIRGFLALVEASSVTSLPHIATLVNYITIETGRSGDYWIHQVATILFPRMRHHCARVPLVELQLGGRCGSLPRTVMCLVARSVDSLELRDPSFLRGEDLLRILVMFPVLKRLALYSVNFTIPPETATTSRIPFSSSLEEVSFDDCTHNTRTWFTRRMMDAYRMPDAQVLWDVSDVETVLELHCEIWTAAVNWRVLAGGDMPICLHTDSGSFVWTAKPPPCPVGDEKALAVRYVHVAHFISGVSAQQDTWTRIVGACKKLCRLVAHIGSVGFYFEELANLDSFVLAFHPSLEEAVGSEQLYYFWGWPAEARNVDLHSVTLRYLARSLGLQLGWCRSTVHGGGSLVCSQVDHTRMVTIF